MSTAATLPLQQRAPDHRLFVVPVVEDAEALQAMGYEARYFDELRAVNFRRVFVVVNRNDGYYAGLAEQIASIASNQGTIEVRLLKLDGKRNHNVAAVLAAMGREGFEVALAKADPIKRKAIKPAVLPAFSNFVEEGTGKDARRVALGMAELDDRLKGIAGDWPKRVGGDLFVEGDDGRPRYLKTPAALFAWLDRLARIDWTKGAAFISQERFFEDRRAHTENYTVVETLPHFPRLEGIHYMHRPVPAGDGTALDRLAGYFKPATDLDGLLIKAMILTWFWGGPPGKRPIFVIEGPENDGAKRGRGVGKTTMPSVLADNLLDGHISVSASDQDMEAVKTRLLSSECGRKRVVLIDNLKSHRLSWGDLESLVTAPNISGRALYTGEGNRPNLLCWVITVNGGQFSKDMAQRCIPIRLDRPLYDPSWEDGLVKFIRDHRWDIVGDIGDVLASEGTPCRAVSRWATWERDVLCKLPDHEGLQRLIASRQSDSDVDAEEREVVIDYFRKQIQDRGRNPDLVKVIMDYPTLCDWLKAATRRERDVNHVAGFLGELSIDNLKPGRCKSYRGWVWTGDDCADDEEQVSFSKLPAF